MAIDPNTGNYVPTDQNIIGGTVQQNLGSLLQPQQVYSAGNISQAVAQPVGKPDLSDPLGMYDYFMGSDQIKNAQSQYQDAFSQLTKANQTARARQLAIEQNPLESMSNIVGSQARAGQLDAQTIQALSENANVAQSALMALKQTAQDKFNIAKSQRDELTQLISSAPGAGISYTDTTEQAFAKLDKYQVAQEEKVKKEAEEARSKAYKQALKEQLLSLGKSVKGLSTNELEKKLKKANKNAIKSAQQQAEIEFNMKLEKHNMEMANIQSLMANRGGSGRSGDDIKLQERMEAEEVLNQTKGQDGFANPEAYLMLRSSYSGTSSDFDSRYSAYLSPAEKYRLGLSNEAPEEELNFGSDKKWYEFWK